jgi:hypothetical protein
MGLDKLEGHPSLTFRKLNGSQAIEGDSDVHLYWESFNSLPFVKKDEGGITQCWLVHKEKEKELCIYYHSLKPGESPDFSGGKGDASEYFVLLQQCEGVNFGYTFPQLPKMQYFGAPLFSNGKNPDLPEIVQVLLGNNNPVT